MMTGIRNANNLVPVYLVLTLIFLLLFALYDYRHHKIRNKALAAFLAWCLLYIPVKSAADMQVHFLDLVFHAVLGCMVSFLLLAFIAVLSDGGIGGGDIKLVTVLAIVLGTAGILGTLLISCFVALAHIAIREKITKKKQESIAFAPYLFTGVLLYVLPQIIR